MIETVVFTHRDVFEHFAKELPFRIARIVLGSKGLGHLFNFLPQIRLLLEFRDAETKHRERTEPSK